MTRFAKLKAFLAVALAFFYGASPIDLIPDLIPLLGFTDDAVVFLTAGVVAWRLLRRKVAHARTAAHRRRI